MALELNDREREVLKQLVERRLHDLGPEIHRTEARDYRLQLEEEQRNLEGILGRL